MDQQDTFDADQGADDNLDDAIIAVVGMACHLPGAKNIQEYWHNLRDGAESVHFFTDEELLAAGESPQLLADPAYVKAQPLLKDFDRFDARFWGWSPQDAAVTDPAHRIFLEVAYQALEHAGHTAYDEDGRVAVFASSGASQYWMDNLKTNPQLMEEMGEFLVRHTGNDMNFLATRLSYELDLRGPSMNVQTACSSTIVGVHMAVQSLLASECDTAIVGGATVLLPQQRGYVYKDGEILSPDGHCRPFDKNSAGTVFGSGGGAVILRRLEDALADGDTIYATVVGSAMNNDGSRKIGYLAPGVEGQAGAISEALEISGVDVEEITYIEAHGTGTQVGDPIEFEALNQVYGASTDKKHYCRVGSVKSNIGHLGEAAGIASFIKVILSLQNKQLPPTINFESPNTDIELDNSPFIINDKLVDWEDNGQQRMAGITALGAGGTNAHIIVGEALHQPEVDDVARDQTLFLLSAKTGSALSAARQNLAQALREQPELHLSDVAYTLQLGRRAYSQRCAIAAKDRDEAISLLEGSDDKRVAISQAGESAASLVLMFPGGGAQYAGMGAELYASEQAYRDAFDECMQCLDAGLADEIRSLVFAPEHNREAASVELERPTRTLPALFATEYALARLFMAWGAKPAAFIGHSMGEYTAACLSGVFELRDAMRLVALRGELFERVSAGGMLSISLSEQQARELMPEHLDIAAVNAPDLCVASGPVADIEALQARLEQQDVDCVRIRINVAAHSSMLEEVLEDFRQFCRSIQFSAPTIPFTSNRSGDWITEAEATSPDYWVEHLRGTVRFADNVKTVVADQQAVLLEVGPGRTLTNLALAGDASPQASINSMRHPSEQSSDLEFALRTYGHLWAAGVDIDWRAFWGDEQRRRVALPSYPFERKAYWIDPGTVSESTAQNAAAGQLVKRANIDDWFGQYQWQQSPAPSFYALPAIPETQRWLVFADSQGIADTVIAQLTALGVDKKQYVLVQRGQAYKSSGENTLDNVFELDAADLDSVQSLFNELESREFSPDTILYLPPIDNHDAELMTAAASLTDLGVAIRDSFWGLFNIGKALGELESPVRLIAASSNLHSFSAPGAVEKSVLLGPVAVIPHELSHVSTQSIDFAIAEDAPAVQRQKIAQALIAEAMYGKCDRHIAYRGLQRWTRTILPTVADVTKPDDSASTTTLAWVKPGGCYLLSGGLGGIGLTTAEYLAEQGAGHIVLVSRSGLPPREEWPTWLQSHAAGDKTSQQIQAIQKIEQKGATVYTPAADITAFGDMKQVVADVESACGQPMAGVIHAAGAMDDQLLLLKSHASAAAVMDAKIKGAIVLDSLFADDQLDFFVVFSSVASILGLPGQIDYAAANAFLDAFVEQRAMRATGQSLAINWNAWREVGMATAANQAEQEGAIAGKAKLATSIANLDYRVALADNESVFGTVYNNRDQWVIAEHQVKDGNWLMPGTGYLNLAVSVAQSLADATDSPAALLDQHTVQISNVEFLSTFELAAQSKALQIHVKGSADAYALQFYSDNLELPHVTAELTMTPAAEKPTFDLAAAHSSYQQKGQTKGRFLNQDFMAFGPRWGCISDINFGESAAGPAALMNIELPAEFAADLADHALHPAMLDMATGGAQFLIKDFDQDKDFYVPVGYKRLTAYAALPMRFCSHVQWRPDSPEGFAEFDIHIVDEAGSVLVQVERFTMRKVSSPFASGASAALDTRSGEGAGSLEEILAQAINPAEGVEALGRVMSQRTQAQWLVSSVDVSLWLQQLDSQFDDSDEPTLRYIRESDEDSDTQSDFRDNPNYVAPETPEQEKIAELWVSTLGINGVGIRDNFFELGGHSLLLIRLATKIKKAFGADLQVSQLFDEPTVENWAKLVETAAESPAVEKKKITRVARGAHRKSS